MANAAPVACKQCSGGIVVIDHDEYDDSYWPVCTKCQLTTERVFGSIKEAVSAWNNWMVRIALLSDLEELPAGLIYYSRPKRGWMMEG